MVPSQRLFFLLSVFVIAFWWQLDDFLSPPSSRRLEAHPGGKSPARSEMTKSDAEPSPEPTTTSTSKPTLKPTPKPTRKPTPVPTTPKPSPPKPDPKPATKPTLASTPEPTQAPTSNPTSVPPAPAKETTPAAAEEPKADTPSSKNGLRFDWAGMDVNFSTGQWRKRYNKAEQVAMAGALEGIESVLRSAEEKAEKAVQKVDEEERREVYEKVDKVSDPVVDQVTDVANEHVANATGRIHNATEVIKKARRAIKKARGDIKEAHEDKVNVRKEAAANVSRWEAEANQSVLEAKKKAEHILYQAQERSASIMSGAETAMKGHKLVHFFQCGDEVVNVVQDQIEHKDAVQCLKWCTREAKFFMFLDGLFNLEKFFFTSKPAALPVFLVGRYFFSFGGDQGLPDVVWDWWFGRTISQQIGLSSLSSRLWAWVASPPWLGVPYFSTPAPDSFKAVLIIVVKGTVNVLSFLVNLVIGIIDKIVKVLLYLATISFVFILYWILCALDFTINLMVMVSNWLAPLPARTWHQAWGNALKGPAAWFPHTALGFLGDKILYMVTNFDGFVTPWRPHISVAFIQMVVHVILFCIYEVWSLIKLTFWILTVLILGVSFLVTLIPGVLATALHFAAYFLFGSFCLVVLTLVCLLSGCMPVALMIIWLLAAILLTLPVMFPFLPLLCLYAFFVIYMRKPELVVNCTKITTAAHFGAMPKTTGPVAGVVVLCIGCLIVMCKVLVTRKSHGFTNLEDACAHALNYEHLLGRVDNRSQRLSMVKVYGRVEVTGFVFGPRSQNFRGRIAPKDRAILLRQLVGLRQPQQTITHVTFIEQADLKSTAVPDDDEKKDDSETWAAYVMKVLLLPVVLLGFLYKTVMNMIAGLLPCVDNYSDFSTSMTFLHSGQPFFFFMTMVGIVHNVQCGLQINPVPESSNTKGLEYVGRVFQADVMEAASQVVRQNEKTLLFYEKVKIQANTENLMNLPIMIFATLNLQVLDETDLLPALGDFLKSHGYAQIHTWAEFVACFVLVIGNVGLMSSTVLSLTSLKEGIGNAPQWCVELSKNVVNSKFEPDWVLTYLMIFEARAVSITLSAALFIMDKRLIYVVCVIFFFVCRLPLQWAEMDWEKSLLFRFGSAVVWVTHPYLFTWPNLYDKATLARMGRWQKREKNAFFQYYLIRSTLLLAAWYYLIMYRLNDLPVAPQVFRTIYDRMNVQIHECELGAHDFTIPWYNATSKTATQKNLNLYLPWCHTFFPPLKFEEVLPLFRNCIVLLGAVSALMLLPFSVLAYCRASCKINPTHLFEGENEYTPLQRQEKNPPGTDWDFMEQMRYARHYPSSTEVFEYKQTCWDYFENVRDVEGILLDIAAEQRDQEQMLKLRHQSQEFVEQLVGEIESHINKSLLVGEKLKKEEEWVKAKEEERRAKEEADRQALEAAKEKAEKERIAKIAKQEADRKAEEAAKKVEEEAAKKKAEEAAKKVEEEAAKKKAEEERTAKALQEVALRAEPMPDLLRAESKKTASTTAESKSELLTEDVRHVSGAPATASTS